MGSSIALILLIPHASLSKYSHISFQIFSRIGFLERSNYGHIKVRLSGLGIYFNNFFFKRKITVNPPIVKPILIVPTCALDFVTLPT